MKNIAVLYPQCSSISAKRLAKAIGAVAINPFVTDQKDFNEYDLVINYGCNRNIKAKRIFNKTKAIAICIDKIKTFEILTVAGVRTVEWVTKKFDIPKYWKYITIRKTVEGHKNEGIDTKHRNQMKKIPIAPLYTEHFYHKKEFRVVVFNSIISIAYEKERIDNEWHFIKKDYKYLIPIKEQCIDAAKALSIDFVGFDVLVNDTNDFVILEANSGPVMTDEVLALFKNYVGKLR